MNALEDLAKSEPASRLELDALAVSLQSCSIKQCGILWWLAIQTLRDRFHVKDEELLPFFVSIQQELVGLAFSDQLILPPGAIAHRIGN